MGRTKFLDRGQQELVKGTILEAVEDSGFSPEEAIPGIILAIGELSRKTFYPEACLDEASNLLAEEGTD